MDKNVDKNTCKFLIDKIIYTNGDYTFKNVCKLKNWGKGGEGGKDGVRRDEKR